MDDVDAAQAQIGRSILTSGDWVTMHIEGVKYMEKPPFKYWMIASSFRVFGVHDWAARIPVALSAILLCWLVARMAGWAFGPREARFAGLSLATSLGLWLFTRILIPDVSLTLSIAFALWAFLRALDPETEESSWWALAAWGAAGLGILMKGLIAAVFPIGTALVFLLATGLWRQRETWRRLRLLPGLLVFLAVAAPWHVLATLQNPPYFDFALHAGPGHYRGFFWAYFFNEHILRFLNLRYPHDYDTVPRPLFWLLHFAWFFPWSAFFFRAVRLQYRGEDRASRVRLLALCWILVVLGFFTFSTTQEYYSMPAYPAMALLIGCAMAEAGAKTWKIVLRSVGVIVALALVAIVALLWASRGYAAPGDISSALAHADSSTYTLSLDHMGDLTIRSFAYLRLPLALAAIAALTGFIGAWFFRRDRAAFLLAVMLVLFFQAARLALIAFDPYMGSWPLANAINHAPPGGLIFDNAYYEFSSIGFYTNRPVLMLNGRKNNLEYGSNAPGAPNVFIDDAGFIQRWRSSDRWYVASENEKFEQIRRLVGADALHPIATAGGKTVYVNH
jgi:hypothetical protein